jgi:hypothetical protein
LNVQNRYLGVSFVFGGGVHYGWIRMSTSTDFHSFQVTVTGYAYETVVGQEIHAGQISDDDASASMESAPMALPSLGMLALGSPGLDLWRRENSSLPLE